MSKRKKKYNPTREVGKITGSLVATSFGVSIPYQVAGSLPADTARSMALQGLGTPTRLMPVIPMVQTGGSLLRSLDMLDVKPHKKRRR